MTGLWEEKKQRRRASNLRQYLSGQAECFSVRSVSGLVLIHRSVYQTHLQRRLAPHTPTWQQTQSVMHKPRPSPPLKDQHIVILRTHL